MGYGRDGWLRGKGKGVKELGAGTRFRIAVSGQAILGADWSEDAPSVREFRSPDSTKDRLKSRIDRLRFECENAEDAFVDPAQWFAADEALERFDAKCEFAKRKGTLAGNSAASQSL